MPIKKLEITNLGPFDKIDFNFDSQVNVFIGPNNCGKSTVLMALAELITFPFGAPERLFRGNKRPQVTVSLKNEEIPIVCKLPAVSTHEIVMMMKKLGYTCFIPALRQNTGFRPKSPMGREKVDRERIRGSERERLYRSGDEEVFDEESSNMRFRYSSKYQKILEKETVNLSEDEDVELEKRRIWSSSPSRITDAATISKIVELDYRAYRKNDIRFRQVIKLATNMASEIMSGFLLGFDHIEENHRGLYPQFSTTDGPLPLDKLSQGTQSVIQWVSRLILGMAEYYDFPEDLNNKKAVLIIDEVDAHMHPEWQRKIIPMLMKNLPNCQLFVSTHSPLILSGLKEGQVQLLNREKNGSVVVTTNEEETVGWSVDETMRWLMGMKDTIDSETEKIVDELGQLRRKNRLTKAESKQLGDLSEEIHKRLVRGKE